MIRKVLTISQLWTLKALGLMIPDTGIYWVKTSQDKDIWFLSLDKSKFNGSIIPYEVIPTLTLEDMLGIIPNTLNECDFNMGHFRNSVRVGYPGTEYYLAFEMPVLDAVYEFLCLLLGERVK